MKSIAHIVVILTFLVLITGYSQQHAVQDSTLIPVDTIAVIDTGKVEIQRSIIDSLSIKSDSVSIARADTIIIDTVGIRFIAGMGQFIQDVDTSSVLHRTQFLWSDAKYVGELIWKLPGFFWRDLGETGKWGQLNAFGMDGRNINILLDGRPINDPVTGTYNLYDLPLEFIDHAEIFAGSASTVVSSSAAGTTLNFVTRSYNSYRPMTKLRFVQDPKGTILTDGIFTQNVAYGLNLMIGFQRHVTEGRYANAELDAWNVRTRLRYNISDRINVSLTDFYTKSGNGLNGGVDRSRSTTIFDETGAVVFSQVAWDKRARRDVTLDAIVRLFEDSVSTTNISMYYSTLEREYRNQNQFQNIDDITKSSFWGVRLKQHLLLNPVFCTFGGQWEERASDFTTILPSYLESERSVFIQAESRLTDLFAPSVSLRLTSLDGENTLSTGTGIKSAVTKWLTLFADASWYDRYPTLQEQYWRDSTVIRANNVLKEQHSFLQGGVNVQGGSNFQLSLTAFQRIVNRAIVFRPTVTPTGTPAIGISNVGEVRSLGLNGSAVFHWRQFEVRGVMTLTRYEQEDTVRILYPDVIFAGELSYRDTFFRDKLDAKFGVRSRFHNRQQGMQFDPQTLSYVQYGSGLIGRSTTLDLFMILKIGDAHISISWENILNAAYMYAPIYPIPGRHFRLGINWVFMD